jgi:hypothetical protein
MVPLESSLVSQVFKSSESPPIILKLVSLYLNNTLLLMVVSQFSAIDLVLSISVRVFYQIEIEALLRLILMQLDPNY